MAIGSIDWVDQIVYRINCADKRFYPLGLLYRYCQALSIQTVLKSVVVSRPTLHEFDVAAFFKHT